ncbi:hypothetical protein CXF83_21865 [Shewanella sp. Choline-02u-19]|uniref:recombinase family protein n=1 Tax=unclassified Shewanella TaxID=196818 RepID=UPI000C342C66|nr:MULTISPECIES: recombinase family protein [unclassified Shewanella]PKH59324.1 hypothetical protein CXF84_03495 [Shewanella sp. Bg11-22]PKI29165.1 hypothetical protein CXF83_21865 [Shewanella sp. Choline-02u-19]
MIYAYCRVSSGKQLSGLSMSLQNDIKLLNELAEKYQTKVSDKVYSDEGLSAYKGDNLKGSLGLLLKDIRSNSVMAGDIIVMRHLDRLSRLGLTAALNIYGEIMAASVSIHTTMDNRLYQKDDQISQILATLSFHTANEESVKKSYLTNRHALERVNQFKAGVKGDDGASFDVGVGGVPFYIEMKNKCVYKSQYFQTAQNLLEFYLEGNGLTKCVDWLAARGLDYTRTGLSNLLKSPALFGQLDITLQGENHKLDGFYPAVCTPERFNLLQARLSQRKASNSGRQQYTLLAGNRFLYCDCGASMSASHTADRGIKYYICINNKCSKTVQRYALDNLVLKHLITHIFVHDDGKRDEILSKLTYEQDQLSRKTQLLFSLGDLADFATAEASLKIHKDKIDALKIQLSDISSGDLKLEDYSKWQMSISEILTGDSEIQHQYRDRISVAVKNVTCHRDGLVEIKTVDGQSSYYYFPKQMINTGRRLGMKLLVVSQKEKDEISIEMNLGGVVFTEVEVHEKKYADKIDCFNPLLTLYSEEHTRYTAQDRFTNKVIEVVRTEGAIIWSKKNLMPFVSEKQWQSYKTRAFEDIARQVMVREVNHKTSKGKTKLIKVLSYEGGDTTNF